MRKQKIALLLISQKVASGCQQTINGFDSAQYFDFGNILNKIKLELILSSIAVSFATHIHIEELQNTKPYDHLFHKSYATTF